MARNTSRRSPKSLPLRRQAEHELRLAGRKPAGFRLPKDPRKLVHELEVHQVELEMQNEELRRAQAQSEEHRIKYQDLYDSAPFGHFVVDRYGKIVEANQTGADLLGSKREYLLGRPIILFAKKTSRPAFSKFIVDLPKSQKEETCQLVLVRLDATTLTVLCKGAVSRTHPGHIRLAISDDSERARALEELKKSHRQLHDLAVRLERAREEERVRIAREIHDELGQALTGLKLDIAWIKFQLSDGQPSVVEKLYDMSERIDATTQTVRDIATQLRPVILDRLGLIAALEWWVGEFQSRANIACNLNLSLRQVRFDEDHAIAVFRIFQEMLTNVARHAQAKTVTVTVAEHAGKFVLEVSDDGVGIPESKLSDLKSLGLFGMRQRAELLNGTLDISSGTGQGTTITVKMPLESRRERETDDLFRNSSSPKAGAHKGG